MGLAHKPDIDDLRESPALQVAETLLAEKKYDLLLLEPNLEKAISMIYLITNLNGNADIVVYLVAHKEFKGFKFDAIELDFCGVKK